MLPPHIHCLKDISMFSPPHISMPSSYSPRCSNQALLIAKRPPAIVGELYGAHGCSLLDCCSSLIGDQSNSSLQLNVPMRSIVTNLYWKVFSSMASITGVATVL